jgi:TonB family protein
MAHAASKEAPSAYVSSSRSKARQDAREARVGCECHSVRDNHESPGYTATMGNRRVASVLLASVICAGIALADDPCELFQDPTKIGVMTSAAGLELDACVREAARSAGDEQERRVMVGVFIGPQGRAISIAVLDSSGLEYLDKLILRCLRRAEYVPAPSGKPPKQWVFRFGPSTCQHRQASRPNSGSSPVA